MSNQQPLDPKKKIDIDHLMDGLENYRPKRKGWVWRKKPVKGVDMGPFHFRNMAEPLKHSIGLPASKYFDGIDPSLNVS